jgi:hypothetical protein
VKRHSTFVAPIPSLVLAVVAALLTLPGSVALWEQRSLIDEQGFVDLGNKVLANEAVQQELAAGITEDVAPGGDSIVGTVIGGILSAGNEGSPVDSAVLKALSLVPDTAAADLALSSVHNQVLEAMRHEVIGTEGDRIYIDLNDAIAQVIPGNIVRITASAGRIEVVEKSDLAGTFRVARWFDGRAVMLCLLPLAVLGMGFFLAPSAGRYALQFGIALFAINAIGFVFVRFVLRARVVGNAIDIERSRDAGNAVFDIFTGGLVTQELLLAVAGLLIAGAGFLLTRRENTGV